MSCQLWFPVIVRFRSGEGDRLFLAGVIGSVRVPAEVVCLVPVWRIDLVQFGFDRFRLNGLRSFWVRRLVLPGVVGVEMLGRWCNSAFGFVARGKYICACEG